MDETSPRPSKPQIGRRLIGRQATMARASGLHLGRSVAARHGKPEPVRAAMRLVPKPAGLARSAAAAGPAAAAAAPAAAASAEPAWEPSPTQSTIAPGLSDWASEWLFGDGDAAIATGTPFMGGAGIAPPTAESKRVARVARGGPEVARAAKIFEGDDGPPRPEPERAGAPEPPAAPADATVARTPVRPASAPAPATPRTPPPGTPARVARVAAQPPS